MGQSENINELAAAVVAAQSDLENVAATQVANTGKFSYKYSDLSEVLDVVKSALSKHNLAIIQTITRYPEPIIAERIIAEGQREIRTTFYCLGSLRTLLLHTSGQWLDGEHPLGGDWGDPQRIGIAISYARRYGIMAICGIAQVDSDGVGATPPVGRIEHARSGHLPQARTPENPASDFDAFDGVYDGPPRTDDQAPSSSSRDERANRIDENKAAYNRMFSPTPPPPGSNAGVSTDGAAYGRVAILPQGKEISKTGKHLYGWIKDKNAWPFFNYLIEKHSQEIPPQITDWSNDLVEWAWNQFTHWHASGAPVPKAQKSEPATNGVNGSRR